MVRLPPYFVLHPTSRRLGLRVRWSISLPFGFTFRSHTNHTIVPPCLFSPNFLLLCSLIYFLLFFDYRLNFVKSFQQSCHANSFACLYRLVERLPRIRRYFLDLAHGSFVGFLLVSATYPRGLFRSLAMGRNHHFSYPPFLFSFAVSLRLLAVP